MCIYFARTRVCVLCLFICLLCVRACVRACMHACLRACGLFLPLINVDIVITRGNTFYNMSHKSGIIQNITVCHTRLESYKKLISLYFNYFLTPMLYLPLGPVSWSRVTLRAITRSTGRS